jgi:hypothetical protein
MNAGVKPAHDERDEMFARDESPPQRLCDKLTQFHAIALVFESIRALTNAAMTLS